MKRRTPLSTLLQYLLNANYDYKLEKLVKLPSPSEKERVALFRSIEDQVGATEADAPACSDSSNTEDSPPEEAALSFGTVFAIPLVKERRVERSVELKATVVRIRQ